MLRNLREFLISTFTWGSGRGVFVPLDFFLAEFLPCPRVYCVLQSDLKNHPKERWSGWKITKQWAVCLLSCWERALDVQQTQLLDQLEGWQSLPEFTDRHHPRCSVWIHTYFLLKLHLPWTPNNDKPSIWTLWWKSRLFAYVKCCLSYQKSSKFPALCLIIITMLYGGKGSRTLT